MLMLDNKNTATARDPVTLTSTENATVEEKVQLQLRAFQLKMINIGWILSIFIGFFVILALYNKVDLSVLLTWYALLMIANTINVYIGFRNRHITPNQTQRWLEASRAYHLSIGLLCLIWGLISVLYTSNDAHYQLYIIAWLQLCIVGFSFGAITDYIACVIANIFILLPYISSRFFTGIYSLMTTGHDPNLNISLTVIPIILSIFSLMACYVGYRVVKQFFKLHFENSILSQKLEDANKFLEQRVKERTLELESSLKLVTFQATHDLLTNLPNQRLLLEYTQNSIDLARKNQHKFAVACLALNEIEKINDSLGHQIGNQVIKAVANRFERSLKESQENIPSSLQFSIALSRKDELVILIEPFTHSEIIDQALKRFFSILDEPVYIEKQAIKLTASIGVSLYPQDGPDVKSLLMNADAAMILAKKQGGNSLGFYKTEMNAHTYKQLVTENQLYKAIENREFILHYQPFVDQQTKQICGAEALIRWNNPALGFVSPQDFIPLAEANGIIVPLGEWVFHTACQQTKQWHDSGYKNLKIAINVSAKQLQHKNFFETIQKISTEINLDPHFIELELTETEAFQEETIPILKKLKSLGFNLSIDDFGTGYSGLSNLKLFAIDKLKIDQSFVHDLATNQDSRAIVANTIDLAKKINVIVIAEGVETKEQLQFLHTHGCNMIQGYYFSPPVDAEFFSKLLKQGLFPQ